MDADLYEQLNSTITHAEQPAHAETEQQPAANQDQADAASSPRRQRTTSTSLPEEFDQVVHAISASPWAARLGSLVGTVRKQVGSIRLTSSNGACREKA
jgi:hypothetical protein